MSLEDAGKLLEGDSSRRTFLRGTAALGATAVAGCTEEDPENTPTDSRTPSEKPGPKPDDGTPTEDGTPVTEESPTPTDTATHTEVGEPGEQAYKEARLDDQSYHREMDSYVENDYGPKPGTLDSFTSRTLEEINQELTGDETYEEVLFETYVKAGQKWGDQTHSIQAFRHVAENLDTLNTDWDFNYDNMLVMTTEHASGSFFTGGMVLFENQDGEWEGYDMTPRASETDKEDWENIEETGYFSGNALQWSLLDSEANQEYIDRNNACKEGEDRRWHGFGRRISRSILFGDPSDYAVGGDMTAEPGKLLKEGEFKQAAELLKEMNDTVYSEDPGVYDLVRDGKLEAEKGDLIEMTKGIYC